MKMACWIVSLLLFATSLTIFPSLASAQNTPTGAVYQTAPFNMNPRHFTMTTCKPKLNCSVSESDAVKTANECASSRFGFPSTIMGTYIRQSGEYKNCVIPKTFATTSPGLAAKAQWPVCCVTPAENNTCRMVCHYYLTNDYNG